MAGWSKSMGPNFVPAYQVSGVPYVTGSATTTSVTNTPQVVNFPQATRFFCITNTNSSKTLRVGFTEYGINGTSQVRPGVAGNPYTANWFEVPAGKMSPRLEIRCKQLWFRAVDGSNPTGFTLIAGLSAVDSDQFPVLTGTLLLSGTDGKPYADGVGRSTFEGVG